MKLNTFNRNYVKNEKMKKFDLILQSQHGDDDEEKVNEDPRNLFMREMDDKIEELKTNMVTKDMFELTKKEVMELGMKFAL